MRDLLSNPPESLSAEEHWLRQKALLTVAADDLVEGDIDQARRRLRRVPTDSPAAVDAALLLAESFRLAGDTEQAQSWYLRVGERFPHERPALEGVVSAATSLESQAPETAAALYDDVSEKAAQAARRLKRLGSKLEQQPLKTLLYSDFDPNLRRQLLEQLARQQGRGAVDLKRRETANTVRAECLLRRSRPLYQAQANLEDKLTELDTQGRKVHKRIHALEKRRAVLEQRIEAGKLTPEQRQIREELMQVRNALQRKKARLEFLEESRERLPRMMKRMERRIQRLYEHFNDQERLSSRTLRQRLSNGVTTLREHFLDLAASADYRKARILEERVSRADKEAD